MAEGSLAGRAVVINSSLQDGKHLLLNFGRKCLFCSRQKVNCINFCGYNLYHLCHKTISAHLWEFTLVTVTDLTFKAFLYNNTNKKNICVNFVEVHKTDNKLYKRIAKVHFQKVKSQYKSTKTYYLPFWNVAWQKFKMEL